MGNIKFEVPHPLSKDEAKQRIAELLKYWNTKYGITSQWTGDSATINGKAMGITVNATLRVAEKTVGGEASDPGILLRGQAKKYLEGKFAEFLDPSWKAAT